MKIEEEGLGNEVIMKNKISLMCAEFEIPVGFQAERGTSGT